MAIDITFLNNNSSANITTNFERVEAALADALSRAGTAPNQMNADLDLNDYNIINVGEVLPGSISAADYIAYAEEWASKAEDSLVSIAAGGDGSTEYSAKHWSAKAEGQVTLASDQVALAAAQVALATTQANNAANTYDDFDDRYLGAKASNPALDNDGDALVVGALVFNTTEGEMKVWDGSAWGTISTTVSRNLYEYTATSGQTVITGADREGNSLSTGDKFLNVHVNGLRLTPIDDYTYDASSVTLAAALNLGDEVLVEALSTFEIANALLSSAQTLTDAEKSQVRDNIDAGLMSGFRNKIINGNFDIWQRATSQTSGGYGSVDRWASGFSGTSMAVSQQAFTLGQTDVPSDPEFYLRNVYTHASGTGNYCATFQRIESVKTFAGKTATVTFYAKADSAKDIAIELEQQFGTGGSPSAYVTEIGVTTCDLGTDWKKFSFTVDVPSIAGKTLGTDDNNSLGLIFWFSGGSDFDARTNSLGNQSGTFDIARVSLVEGDATNEADPYEPRHIALEKLLCEWYYREIGAGTNDLPVDMLQLSESGTIYQGMFSFPAMRDIPSAAITYTSIHKPSISYDTGTVTASMYSNRHGMLQALPTTTSAIAQVARLSDGKIALSSEL